MATYKELVYMALDELKLTSDDSHFKEEHIIFLLDKYRAFLLKQRYTDIKKEIPESNYQTVCLDLEKTEGIEGDPCSGTYLKSVQEVPDMLTIAQPKVSSLDYFGGDITYTNRDRFKYAGCNKYLRNIIYSTIAPDNHLYIKGKNPQTYYMEKVRVTGIFEDSAKASELSCEGEDKACDILDRKFPIEEGLVTPLLELIVKELTGYKYQPKDQENNANDDLSRLATYLSRNLKKGWQRDDS